MCSINKGITSDTLFLHLEHDRRLNRIPSSTPVDLGRRRVEIKILKTLKYGKSCIQCCPRNLKIPRAGVGGHF